MLEIGQKITLKISKTRKKIQGKVIYKNKFYFIVQDTNSQEKESFQWHDIKAKTIEVVAD